MNILHIIPSLRKGGAERLVLNICNEISKRSDHSVRLIVFSVQNEYSQLSNPDIVKYINARVVPSITGKATIELDDLLRFITEFKPDVIHSHLFEAEMVSRSVVFPHIKYFSHCHDNMFQLKSFSISDLFSKKRITELYERHLILKQYRKCGNNFIAISQHTMEYSRGNVDSYFHSKIVQLHNAIDYDQFYRPVKNKPDLHIVNVGSFVLKKNQRFFIPIAQKLKQLDVNFRITLLGNGELFTSIKQEIAANGLNDYFEMPGMVQDVEKYYESASLYVHTATYEPFGLVLLEAMAAGLPVVSLDGGGNREIIVDGENGYLLANQNSDLIVERILQLHKNQTLYMKMANRAQTFAQQFDIKAYVDRLLLLYAQS